MNFLIKTNLMENFTLRELDVLRSCIFVEIEGLKAYKENNEDDMYLINSKIYLLENILRKIEEMLLNF